MRLSSLRSFMPPYRTGVGDTIHLGTRTLRVVALRDVDGDVPPVLVVEDIAGLDG